MVGLKYTGKKIPFRYEGENIRCGKMSWSKRGQVIEALREDAEEMENTSPTDFEMIVTNEDEPDAPITALEKGPLDGVDFSDPATAEGIPDEAMPKEDVTPEEVVKGPATKTKAKNKGGRPRGSGKKKIITKVEPFFQEHD